MVQPPLRSLHPDSSLSQAKLDQMRKLSDAELIGSLHPDQIGTLKTRPDGTILDGHHRIKVLEERGIDVHSLPREVVARDDAG